MSWIVAMASLVATWLNVRGDPACFMIWSFTNAVWAGLCFTHGLPAQGFLHLVYLGMAIWGLRRWGNSPPRAAKPDTARAVESPP